MHTTKQDLGTLGERVAAKWLTTNGWAILDRRFRNGHRDIDLVARRDGVTAFVEVKSRSANTFGDPVEAVSWQKQRELRRSAQVWIDRHGTSLDSYRFDVIGVLLDGPNVRVRHVENAFTIT